MGEFASEGKANAGLTTGIIGTTLGGLWALGAGNGGNNGGLLGGLFGNGGYNNQYVSALQSQVTGLQAEKYADKNTADVYKALRSEIKDMGESFIKPMAQEIADMRVREAVNAEKIACMEKTTHLREDLIKSELTTKIDNVAHTCGCGISQLNNAVASINDTLGSITKTIIPRTVICPEVMQRFNSWVAPTAEAPATQGVTGNITVS